MENGLLRMVTVSVMFVLLFLGLPTAFSPAYFVMGEEKEPLDEETIVSRLEELKQRIAEQLTILEGFGEELDEIEERVQAVETQPGEEVSTSVEEPEAVTGESISIVISPLPAYSCYWACPPPWFYGPSYWWWDDWDWDDDDWDDCWCDNDWDDCWEDKGFIILGRAYDCWGFHPGYVWLRAGETVKIGRYEIRLRDVSIFEDKAVVELLVDGTVVASDVVGWGVEPGELDEVAHLVYGGGEVIVVFEDAFVGAEGGVRAKLRVYGSGLYC